MAEEEFNHFDQVFAEIDQQVNKLVRATAFRAEGIAKHLARVDTGHMRNAIYTRTEEESDRPSLADLFPETEAPPHNEAWIVGGAIYTLFNEYGTIHMPAQPMFTPAIEQVRQPFLSAL